MLVPSDLRFKTLLNTTSPAPGVITAAVSALATYVQVGGLRLPDDSEVSTHYVEHNNGDSVDTAILGFILLKSMCPLKRENTTEILAPAGLSNEMPKPASDQQIFWRLADETRPHSRDADVLFDEATDRVGVLNVN